MGSVLLANRFGHANNLSSNNSFPLLVLGITFQHKLHLWSPECDTDMCLHKSTVINLCIGKNVRRKHKPCYCSLPCTITIYIVLNVSVRTGPSQWPLLALYQLSLPCWAPLVEPCPPRQPEEERASCHGQAGWELGRPAVAQELFPLISTSFICPPPLPFLPPSIHPSIPSSFLLLPLPVDQHSLHAELHCAQSAVAEQMVSLLFLHSLAQSLRV